MPDAETSMKNLDKQHRDGLFQQVVEMAPNAMVMIDRNGLIELVNAQTENIFGYARADMLGQSIDMLLPERFRAAHPHHRAIFFDQPTPRAMGVGRDLFGRRKDGSEFPVEIGLNPLETTSGFKVLSSILDISERKKIETHQRLLYEEIARINEELNNFAYVSSHDLKSPLRGIDQLATWITEDLADTLSDDTKQHLRLMRSRIKRMEMLLDDLLDYCRVGRSDFTVMQVDTRALVNDILEMMAPTIPIQLKLDTDLPVLLTKKVPLEMVLRNLISNAIKHHDKQRGTIAVSARLVDDSYEFTIKDDGPGIPEAHHQRIFGMFQTLRPRDEIEGSGIGLALVKKTVESMGGEITVESDGQLGCTFRFTWPKAQER